MQNVRLTATQWCRFIFLAQADALGGGGSCTALDGAAKQLGKGWTEVESPCHIPEIR